MKKVLIVVLIFLTGITYAQITFEKYHFELSKIASVAETGDGGFIFGSMNQAVTLLDKYGDVKWTKKFDNLNIFAQDVLYNSEGLVYLVTTQTGEKKDIFLHKLDLDGNVLWTKKYGTPEDDNGYYLRETHDGGLLILGSLIIKMDKNGAVEWQKASPVTWGNGNSVLIGSNGRIFIAKSGLSNQLNVLDSSGTLLYTKSFKSGNYSLIEMKEHIFLAGGKGIHKLDYDGNLIWSKTVSDYYSIAEYDAEKFVIASKDSILQYDGDYNLQWAKKIPGSTLPKIIRKVSDGYILTGESGWILKTDTEGNHVSLQIVKPSVNETVRPGTYTIRWTRHDVPNITVEFSKDNGNTWSNIANITNTDSVQWSVPSEFFDAVIRIYKTDEPDIRDLSAPFKVHWNNTRDYIAVNQIWMWTGNNGMGSHDPVSDGPGMLWPIVQGIPAVFQDGLVWGGKVNGKIFVNGSTYRSGLVPGKILSDGTADNPNSYKYGLWKINKFWESQPEGEKKEQLKLNYDYWPGELGAPYKDVNGDGVFTRDTDKPEFPGDEVLWMVANDLDSNASKFAYGSTPVGLEVQITTYGFNRYDDLGDVIFKKYKMINKSKNTIDDMYFTYWSDPDLGYAADDFVGCDTLLNLAYCYNGDNDDQGYYGANPPAVGYKVVQGPVKDSPGDTAYYQDQIVPGKRNIPVSSFQLYVGGDTRWADPTLGDYSGTIMFYNQMEGKIWDGADIVDPVSNNVTRFPLSGDPVTGTGWYEGPGWPGGDSPGDRRMILSSGPFSMAPEETQEVVYAIIFARGTDYINSVAELKRKSQVVQDFYNNRIITDVTDNVSPALNYSLGQNYPNPFNPTTTIKYSLAEKSFVEINVYDILGEKVMTLINEERPAGEYQVSFNAHNLSSGVYYYQMKTKDYISTKKMILIK